MEARQASNDGYILARVESEYERLRAQARVWEPATERVLTKAGIAPGMRCLDAGCGPGEVMRLMGRLVGPAGEVTGTDLDAGLGRHALAQLRRDAGGRFAFAEHDITGVEAVPGGPFDLVFARFLLIHMTDPAGALRRLGAQVAPGGKLVLMDYDLSRMTIRPEEAGVQRALDVVAECFTRSGKRADAGLRLPQFLQQAELPAPEGSVVEPLFGPIALVGPMLRGVLGGALAGAAAALGVAPAADVRALIEHVGEVEAANRHFALGPLLVGVWATVGRA